MTEDSTTRRGVARAAGGLAALLATGVLAGCQSGGQATETSTREPTGTPETRMQPPATTFAFDYDGAADTVAITHDSGEAIPVETLAVRGDGFADASSADMTAAGPWAGGMTDGGTVSAGNSVVVGVAPDWYLRVVWEPTAADRAWTLSEDSGPEA